MRFLIFFVFLLGLQEKVQAFDPLKPVLPDKNLKEMIFYGDYYPAEVYRVKQAGYSSDQNDLPFTYSGRSYCYNKTQEKPKIYDQNLKVRLYNKEGKILAEDFLRARNNHRLLIFSIFYLPYRPVDKGEVRLVHITKDKEYVIGKYPCCPSEKHITNNASSYAHYNIIKNWSFDLDINSSKYVYHKESECFFPLL